MRQTINHQEFMRLHGEGATDKRIAKAMGFAVNSIIKYRLASGLPPNPEKIERRLDWGRIAELKKSGGTTWTISKQIGCSDAGVAYAIGQMETRA